MLTYKTGAVCEAIAASNMAAHLLQPTMSDAALIRAAYYQSSPVPASPGVTAAEPRADMDPRLARALGIDPTRALGLAELTGLLGGGRTDGSPIPGKQRQRGVQSTLDALGLCRGAIPTAVAIDHIAAGRRADGADLCEDVPGTSARKLFAAYGVAAETDVTKEQLLYIRRGLMADGRSQPLIVLPSSLAASRVPTAYVDFTFSADKSVSIAFAFAETDAERAIIHQAHRAAVQSTLPIIEREIGRARRGRAGSGGFEPSFLAWVIFDHYTSRSTVEFPAADPITGKKFSEFTAVRRPGDPNLHTHCLILNAGITKDGRIAGLHLQRLEGRVKEWGAVYQAFLATRLREQGVKVELDSETGAAVIPGIPILVRAAFSRRTHDGAAAARHYMRTKGVSWENLSPGQQVALVKAGVQGDPRGERRDDVADTDAWRREALRLNWKHRSVIEPTGVVLRSREDRFRLAYDAGCDLLEPMFTREAVLREADLRVAAARGLVSAGIEEAADIDTVMREFAERGVRHNFQVVGLIRNQVAAGKGFVVEYTTTLHVEQETELVSLVRAASADQTGALTGVAIADAVGRSGKNFSSGHGLAQRRVMDALGQGGRFAVAIGVAGAGKTTLLAPLVNAWTLEHRTVYGASLAWRQADDLAGAGIPRKRLFAFSVLLDRAERGELDLTDTSVVIIDELGLLGTNQLLRLLRLRQKQGFGICAVGDPRQCQAIEAGQVIDLIRRALGSAVVPELRSSVRQATEAERETTLMFREGRAAEAVARKRADGTALLVAGGYEDAVARVASLWQERLAANANDPEFSISCTAPTNADARAISGAIREGRRAAGEIGPDIVVLQAADQHGTEYDLPLARGDRVRLFRRTNASKASDRTRGILGNNGTVVEVLAIDEAGLTLRNGHGREGHVKFDTLRKEAGGRILLAHGDCLTIDAAQGLTSTEHIDAMPSGSRAVNIFKGYVAASRSQRLTWLITSEGAERQEVAYRYPLGIRTVIDEEELWSNVVQNLTREPKKSSALELLEKAGEGKRSALTAMHRVLQPIQQHELETGQPFSIRPVLHRQERTAHFARVAHILQQVTGQQIKSSETASRLAVTIGVAVRRTLTKAVPAIVRAWATRFPPTLNHVFARNRRGERIALLASSVNDFGDGQRRVIERLQGVSETLSSAVRKAGPLIRSRIGQPDRVVRPDDTGMSWPRVPAREELPEDALKTSLAGFRQPADAVATAAAKAVEFAGRGAGRLLKRGSKAADLLGKKLKDRLTEWRVERDAARIVEHARREEEAELDREMARMPPNTPRWQVAESLKTSKRLARMDEAATRNRARVEASAINEPPIQSPTKPPTGAVDPGRPKNPTTTKTTTTRKPVRKSGLEL